MPIDWDADPREFHLRTGRTSYVMRVLEGGALGLLHFGAPLAEGRSYRHLVSREFRGFSNRLGETVALEDPTPGVGDYRIPALAVDLADGPTAIELGYVGHRILAGKPSIPGLPSTYAEADGEAAFGDLPVVVRGAIVRNLGDRALTIRCAMSASLNLPDARWHLVQLSGIWARERHVVIRPLAPGRTSVGSLRGASGHEHNPFVGLIRPTTTEDQGEAIGFSLVYSGNFLAEAEVDPFRTTRVRLGIHLEQFAWRLEPGEELATPEAVLAWTDRGFGGLTDAYHGLYRERLARGAWRDRARPVLLNTWDGPRATSTRNASWRWRGRLARWGSNCSSSTTAGSGSAMTTRPRSATGSSIAASCRTGSTAWPAGSRTSTWASGCGSNPRW